MGELDNVAKVDTTRGEYDQATDWWRRCRDVFAGSDAVKRAGQIYLPALGWKVHEREQRYAAYLRRALFFNAMARTVGGLLGAIFRKPMAQQIPSAIEPHLADVTLTAVSLESFAMKACEEVLLVGRYGVLVDMAPATSTDGTGEVTADPSARPFFVPYLAEQIINWRTTVQAGDSVLTLLVLREHCDEPDPSNRFATKKVDRYRVLELVEGVYTVTIWTRSTEGYSTSQFVPGAPMVPTRRGAPLPFIPFVIINPTDVDPSISRPPLLDLVDVNLSHYRSSADLEHGLHYVAIPTPWIAGLKSVDTIELGASTVIRLDDPAAKAGMLEFTGTGLAAIEKRLEEKQKYMAVLGGRLLENAPTTAETASAVLLRHAGDGATLKTIALNLGVGLTEVLRIHSWWFGLDVPDDQIVVTPNTEFFGLHLPPDEVRLLLEALQAGKLSFESWFDRMQRGDWIRPTVTIEQERTAIQADGPPAAA